VYSAINGLFPPSMSYSLKVDLRLKFGIFALASTYHVVRLDMMRFGLDLQLTMRQSPARILLQPCQPKLASNEVTRGAKTMVPAPEPQVEIPRVHILSHKVGPQARLPGVQRQWCQLQNHWWRVLKRSNFKS
jgi:hypothetical protein